MRALFLIFCLVGLLLPCAVMGADAVTAPAAVEERGQVQEKEEVRVEDILKELLPDAEKAGYVYQSKGRTDPFMPFITEARVQAELAGAEKTLTGMQLFEPAQLTLVGIINAGPSGMAMVQDSAGKGYIVRKGTKIGRHGVVADIVPNIVLVKELVSVNTLTKKKSYKTTQMVLKKEGVTE